RIRFATAAAGLNAKKMRFHGGLAPREKFHAHAGSGFEDFSLVGPHEAGIFRRGFKKREDIRAIKTRNAAQRGNGGAHLPAFERTEKADRNLRRPRHLREGQATPSTQSPEALAGKRIVLHRRRNHTL